MRHASCNVQVAAAITLLVRSESTCARRGRGGHIARAPVAAWLWHWHTHSLSKYARVATNLAKFLALLFSRRGPGRGGTSGRTGRVRPKSTAHTHIGNSKATCRGLARADLSTTTTQYSPSRTLSLRRGSTGLFKIEPIDVQGCSTGGGNQNRFFSCGSATRLDPQVYENHLFSYVEPNRM